MPANELVVMGEDTGVSLWRNPETVLAEAQQAAKALIKVVDLKPKNKKVTFNGETYLEFEDWQTVSKFYGCTTKIISTSPVEFDGVRGFEATAVVLDRNQNEIGRVDSMCLSDEENWGDVPKYEWINELDEKGNKIWVPAKGDKKGYYKGFKKEVGRAPKPLFQLRSMAQTRAQVKALRSIFSWVVVLAGYQPTPAEELTGNEFHEDDSPQDDPKKAPVEMPKATVSLDKFDAAGTITGRGVGKDGTLWLNIGDHLLAVPVEKIGSHPFNTGDKIAFSAIEKSGKERTFWVMQSVTSYTLGDPLPPIGDGPLPAKPKDEMDKAIEAGVFDQTEPIGTLEETRSGKVGKKRQTRLWTLMNVNKKKTGLDEEKVHAILDKMKPPVAHLEELNMDMYKTFEQIMTGEVDWAELV